MRKFSVKYDWLLFGLLMVFLFLALIQQWTGLFPIRPLGGVIEPTPKPELTLENYRNTQYQRQLEAYISENFGLRWLVSASTVISDLYFTLLPLTRNRRFKTLSSPITLSEM